MIVENGTGIVSANSLVSLVFADQYFLERANAAWTGTDAVKTVALIKGTDYFEKRFGHRLAGSILYPEQMRSQALLTFTGNPASGETLTIGSTSYEFGTDITIAARVSDTIDNIIVFVNDDSVELVAFSGLSMIVQAAFNGEDGNIIPVSTDSTVASWSSTTLVDGYDEPNRQGLSFPRNRLYVDGYPIFNVPRKIKQAVSEYSVRALTGELILDPALDQSGNLITKRIEKIGPIEEEYEYLTGFTTSLNLFPAADSLVTPFLGSRFGGVYR